MLIFIFIILLFASLVLFHEWGHFLAARRGGVEVEEFGFGFPPRLVGRKWGRTLYSLNLLPLGGFVRMKGEDAADRGPGTFGSARLSTKAKILLAGVGMNLLSALLLLYILCVTGLPALGAQFEPSFLRSTYAQPRQLLVTEVEPGTPAAGAGLKTGDMLVSANGERLTDDSLLRDFTKSHAGQEVSLLVHRTSGDSTVKVRLRSADANGTYLGVGTQAIYKLRYDPLRAVVAAAYITGTLLVATIVGVFQLLIHIPALIIGLFGHSVPQAAQAASGPLGIILILKSIASLGLSYIVLFMANISVALAAFNILPLPALDGGRLAVIVVQRVTKRQWSADAEARYHAIGFLALLALIALISVYDFRKFF